MNTTKRSLTSRLAVWLGAAALAAGLSGTALAASGITNTKHNLSTTAGNPGANKLTAGTDQICVFCHTPHGSDTTAVVPLWNKKLTSGPFTTYDSLGTSTLNGGVLAVGSVSLACLSCHDGTQAMDNMMNAPGAGGYNVAGARLTGATWALAVGATGLMPAGIANLGTDLKNDHPVGVEYCGGGITGTGTTVTSACKDGDFIAGSSTTTSDGRTAQVNTASVNSKQVFWVDVDGTAGRGKGDLMLYTRDFTSKGGAAAGPSVECGSCHDPHVESKGSDNIMFMRVTTAGSKICLSCHVK